MTKEERDFRVEIQAAVAKYAAGENTVQLASSFVSPLRSSNGEMTNDFYRELEKLVCAFVDNTNDNGYNANEDSFAYKVNKAFTEVITKLRANWRVQHPTKYEKILEIFRSRPNEDIKIDELTELFKELPDPRYAAMNKIARLNAKLEPYDLRIVRVRCTYRVVTLEEKN